jgi:UDPglucose 6-dehydrogenase
MDNYRIGIVGVGFVGGAMRHGFSHCFENLETWDIDPSRRTKQTFDEFVHSVDIIFICVPTPTNQEDGSCDTSIVESVVADISKIDRRKYAVIKSTVPPGTTKRLSDKYQMVVGFNPEFLTEANANLDFINQPLIVIGADDVGISAVMQIIYENFSKEINRYPTILVRSNAEAEMFKYLANTFLAMKVTFANEIQKLCEASGIDYSRVAEVAVLDKRLGKTHWRVPGPDGKFGFGGSCFPKDTKALVAHAKATGAPLELLEKAIQRNVEFRGDVD